MNNIIKMRILTSLVFTLIAIGLFRISTASIVDDVFGEKDQQVKNRNIEGNIATSISSKNGSEKCSP